jgi:hypothetical protein
MSDSSFTIGNFAEGLINSELGKSQEDTSYIPEATSTQQSSPNVPDLRNVQVPSNFMKEILGESTEQRSEVLERPINEEGAVLFEKLHSLIKELDSVLSEMTMTGHLGVNQSGPGLKPKAMKRPVFDADNGVEGYIPSTKGAKSAKNFLKKLNKLNAIPRSKDDARDPGEDDPGIADDLPTPIRLRKRKRTS